MTVDEMIAVFDEENDEYIKFDRVQNPLSARPDMHAFRVLEGLDPEYVEDMVAAAEHDEIYLGVDPEVVAAGITREGVIDLIRCGVRWDSSNDGFSMFR